MPYKKLTGIILKKQNYREADQIVSVWTREAGKIRIMARSIRKPASKLNFAMQDLSEVEIYSTGSSLPTLIGAKPIRQFTSLSRDLKKTAAAFYAAELMLKMTADEHPNFQAYELLSDFLGQLESQSAANDYFLIDNFALGLASVLGFGSPGNSSSHNDVNKFLEYILERRIKSETFLVTLS
jgi:DNA repair protein RecO (recombination protein O)